MVENITKKLLLINNASILFNRGANLIDIGGESTRPGSKAISSKIELKRLKEVLKRINKKIIISLDTRKADVMEKGIKH